MKKKKRVHKDSIKTLNKMMENSNIEVKILSIIKERFGNEVYFQCLQGEFFYFGGIWYLLLPEYLLLPLLKKINNPTGTIHIEEKIVKLWNTDTGSIIRIHNIGKQLKEEYLQ